MKATSLLKLTLAAGTLSLLAACGGGGGGSSSVSTGGVVYSHEQLAQEFVNRALGDAGLNLTLVKANTLQYNYAVVYDYATGLYTAVDLTNFTVGENVQTFIDYNSDSFYQGIDPVGANLYQDPVSGVTFEETTATSMDLEKLAALKQGLQISKSSAMLKAQFGLSDDRSQEVARLAVQMANTAKGSMTDADYDNFSKELLGSSITEIKKAVSAKKAGDASSLTSLMDKAAKVNGVGPEHMNEIVKGLFD